MSKKVNGSNMPKIEEKSVLRKVDSSDVMKAIESGSFGYSYNDVKNIPVLEDYKEKVWWVRDVTKNHFIIKPIFETYKNFGIGKDLSISVEDLKKKTNKTKSKEAKTIEDLLNNYFSFELDLIDVASQIFAEAIRSGKVCITYDWKEVDYMGSNVVLPSHITLHDPLRVDVIGGGVVGFSYPVLTIARNDKLKKIVKDKSPIGIYNSLPKNILDAYISDKNFIEFASDEISLLLVNKQDYENEVNPLFFSAYVPCKMLDKMMEMDYNLMDGAIGQILLASVGQIIDGRGNVNKTLMAYIDSVLANPTSSMQLVLPDTVKLQFISPDLKALLNENKYKQHIQNLYNSLGVSTSYFDGMQTNGNISVSIKNMINNIVVIRNQVVKFLRKEIFKKIIEKNGWDSLDIPKIDLQRVQLDEDKGLLDMYDRGRISAQTFVEEAGMNFEREEARIKNEVKSGTYNFIPPNPSTTPGILQSITTKSTQPIADQQQDNNSNQNNASL